MMMLMKITTRISRAFMVLSAMAALIGGCGGGGGSGEEAGCGEGPFFVSDTYQYDPPSGQVGRDYNLAPRNPPSLCGAHYEASALPTGLTINASSGVISGRPTVAQSVATTVTLSSSSYTGTVTRSFTIRVDPYPAAPNGWTLLNAASPLPQPRETFAAVLGSDVFALTASSTTGNLVVAVAKSADGGASWSAAPGASQATNRPAFDMFNWLAPTADGQAVYLVSYEWPTTGAQPVLYTRRFDGISWSVRQAVQAPPARGGYSVVAVGGTLYLIGGQPGNPTYIPPKEQNDWTYSDEVWRSSDQGLNWTMVSSGTSLPARAGHCSVAASGLIYVYGGHDKTAQRTDLWKSSDGVTWIQVGSSGSFAASATRSDWIENCTVHGAQIHVAFDSYSWRGNQSGHFDLASGAWNNDGPLPVADSSDTRRFHPGLTSRLGKLLLVGGGCGPTSCTVGRDDAWSR
jgi:hypothetical protein